MIQKSHDSLNFPEISCTIIHMVNRKKLSSTIMKILNMFKVNDSCWYSMIVHDSWWPNGSARSTIIDYHVLFDQGLKVILYFGKFYSNFFFPLLFYSFIEDFFQKPGVTLTEEQKRIYKEDLYMSNLPEKDVYISQLKAAGFTDIQVWKIFNASCF